MNEEWKTLIYQQEHFDNFEVSNTGKLRNVATGTEYKLHTNNQGYKQVCVSLGSRAKKKIFKIHRAVAETFIRNPDNKSQINHIDGNKLNNNVDNLEWVTPKENIKHAYDTNLIKKRKGEDNPSAKLTNEQAEYIRKNYISKDKVFGCIALANKFNVSHSRVSRIIHNKAYVDI